MKSVRLQLLVTLAATVTVVGVFAVKGLPPRRSISRAAWDGDAKQVRRYLHWISGMDSSYENYVRDVMRTDPSSASSAFLDLDGFGDTGLHHTVARGRTEIVELLLAGGANVMAGTMHGDTPLHAACWWALEPNREIVELLVTHGAEVNATDENGRTPLYYATRRGWTEIADLLRRHGARE